ncbi:ESX secretion-associated protein EspG [Rhodococcus sp. MEB064]|uniref:ESX secretion-associated protein EspG n=1 Tax=Rhodococcus sp. MEB064 TaxID=1587522 RepID=UPI0005ACC409|nr:ESX secretion-associated protein EspG [Rhodococcus sp. MEB064]KIQ19415.1 hypothetical protein RU01_05750 [Rhodococcus sp. MEB064]
MTAPVLGGPPDVDGPITLDIAELGYVLGHARLGPLPTVLGPTPPGVGDGAGLAVRGLLTPTGAVQRRLLGVLTTVTSPSWSVEVRVVSHPGNGAESRYSLCGNHTGVSVWVTSSGGSMTFDAGHGDSARTLVSALGTLQGELLDTVHDATAVVAERLSTLVPQCTRHVEIVGLTHGSGPAVRVGPVVAVYDSPSGRILASTSSDADGHSWTTLSSGTLPRLTSAVRGVISAATAESSPPDHLVAPRRQPMGSSGVRLPFVSNGGV